MSLRQIFSEKRTTFFLRAGYFSHLWTDFDEIKSLMFVIKMPLKCLSPFFQFMPSVLFENFFLKKNAKFFFKILKFDKKYKKGSNKKYEIVKFFIHVSYWLKICLFFNFSSFVSTILRAKNQFSGSNNFEKNFFCTFEEWKMLSNNFKVFL